MDLNRLRSILAAPMAALFLILVICIFGVQRPVSVGMHVPVLRVRAVPGYDCPGIDRSIYVQLHKDGSYWLNEEQVSSNELRARLAEIYENREEKYILMFPDTNVSYGEFADFYDKVVSSTSDLHIILRTRKLQEQLDRCPKFGSCGLDWPDHTYLPCVYHPPLDLVPTRRVVDPVGPSR